jgi:hypothetical protein
MGNSEPVWTLMAVMAVACLVAVALYKWNQQQRVHVVESWVKQFLFGRYGELPNHLRINCSNDLLWPVFAHFEIPQTAVPHIMQFDCGGARPDWRLLSERDDQR